MLIFVLLISLLVNNSYSFHCGTTTVAPLRLKPLKENFFLSVAEDPAENTPKELLGEVAYRNFVAKENPNALLVKEYDIIGRIRQLKLLTLVADSGLFEALEERGLTLSKLEQLLPTVDSLKLVSLALDNKGLLKLLAPLVIEPAPVMIPLVVRALRTPATNFLAAGAVTAALAGYEVCDENVLLAAPLVLLAAPLLAVGTAFQSPHPAVSIAPSPTANRAVATSVPTKMPAATTRMTPRVASVSVTPFAMPKLSFKSAVPSAPSAPLSPRTGTSAPTRTATTTTTTTTATRSSRSAVDAPTSTSRRSENRLFGSFTLGAISTTTPAPRPPQMPARSAVASTPTMKVPPGRLPVPSFGSRPTVATAATAPTKPNKVRKTIRINPR